MVTGPGFWDQFWPQAASGVVGVLVEVALGWYLITGYFARKQALDIKIEKVCTLLRKLARDCASYWLQDAGELRGEAGGKKGILLEARIKTHLQAIPVLVQHVHEEFVTVPDTLRLEIQRLTMLATGGAFETTGRTADRAQYMRIINCIHQLDDDLCRLRLPIWAAFKRGRKMRARS